MRETAPLGLKGTVRLKLGVNELGKWMNGMKIN